MYVAIALASHVIGTIVSYIFGSAGNDQIVDVGHTVFLARPGVRPWVDLLTCAIPLVVGMRHAERSLVTFFIMTMLRGLCITLTILPPLLPVQSPHPGMLLFGHGYDSVFSGHAAFVASWVLNAPGHVTFTLGVLHAIGLITTRMHYTVDVFVAWVIAWLIHSLQRPVPPRTVTLRYVTTPELDDVAKLRHEVYAEELGQFDIRDDEQLPESTAWNRVLIGAFDEDDVLVGYIGVTMPGGTYSLESYGLPKPEGDVYEIRALCVDSKYRRRGIGKALVHAALRFVQSSGTPDVEVIAMARHDLVSLYVSHGMKQTGECVTVNGLWYFVVRGRPDSHLDVVSDIDWNLPFSKTAETSCFHGGASLACIEKTNKISADVLDAWYDPSPTAVHAMTRNPEWAMRTSPPTRCEPLVEAISDVRGISPENIAIGAGSSDLIFRCFTHWLRESSRVLLVEPTYGEYAHVLHNVIGCTVDSLELSETDGFQLDVDDLINACADTRYDLVVMVNPSNPFGTHHDITDVVARLGTRVWIDETYIDYVGPSLEYIAATSPNVVVCKSMSKIYALSGCRVGYICGHPSTIGDIRARTPPWIVGRPAQAAAIAAIRDVSYYTTKIEETHTMRVELERELSSIPGVEVFPGCANWTLVKLNVDVEDVVRRCAEQNVYVRDTGIPGLCRIAVRRENDTIVAVLRDVLTK